MYESLFYWPYLIIMWQPSFSLLVVYISLWTFCCLKLLDCWFSLIGSVSTVVRLWFLESLVSLFFQHSYERKRTWSFLLISDPTLTVVMNQIVIILIESSSEILTSELALLPILMRPCWPMPLWPWPAGVEVRGPNSRGGGPEPPEAASCCCCCCCCWRRAWICCGDTEMG